MSDALPQKETENLTDLQTGEPNGQAGLPHQQRRASSVAVRIVLAVLVLGVFAFASFGFGETDYTSRHWLKTIATGGGLLPKLFSGSSSVAVRAAADTLHGNFEMTKGNAAESQKAYKKALVAYEALDAVNTFCGQFCLAGLGKAQIELKQEVEAQKTIRKSIEAAKAVFGNVHETVASASRELAFSFTREKKYPEAETLYRDALTLDTKGLGPDHFDVAYDMSCVGEMLLLQKKYPDAIKFLSDSLVIYKKARGEYHPSFLWVEEALGKAYYQSESYAQAARQFEHVLSVSDRLHGTPGKDYIRDLAWLGWSYYYDHNPERARIRAKKLKSILDEKSDVEVGNISDALESNGDLFMMIDEYQSAIKVFERLLKVQEAKYGNNDPRLRSVLLYLSQCSQKMGNSEDAKRYSSRADAVLDDTEH